MFVSSAFVYFGILHDETISVRRCEPVPFVENAFLIESNLSVNGTATVQCFDGYRYKNHTLKNFDYYIKQHII